MKKYGNSKYCFYLCRGGGNFSLRPPARPAEGSKICSCLVFSLFIIKGPAMGFLGLLAGSLWLQPYSGLAQEGFARARGGSRAGAETPPPAFDSCSTQL